MRVAFIASEYNPFHNGHKHLIDKAVEASYDAVVCVMSGNFVQRGEPACADKILRAEAAVYGGADLVIELPMKYAVSTASYFAKGFIDTVKATGLDGDIAFGASADKKTLLGLKDLIYSDECQAYTEKMISQGLSYPAAKAHFIKEYYPETDVSLLDDANNILALEYLNATETAGLCAGVFAVERIGAAHDSEEISGKFASAGYIRRKIYEDKNIDQIEGLLPDRVFDLYKEAYAKNNFPVDMKAFDIAAFSRLICYDAEYFREINNVTGGIENRISDAVKNSSCLSELYDKIKSRHYTHSRIRQIILSSVLGIKKSDLDRGVSFIRILAFNDKGREVLRKMKKSASVPVITNLSQTSFINESVTRDAELDYSAGKFYNLCRLSKTNPNPEFEIHPVYVKNSST